MKLRLLVKAVIVGAMSGALGYQAAAMVGGNGRIGFSFLECVGIGIAMALGIRRARMETTTAQQEGPASRQSSH